MLNMEGNMGVIDRLSKFVNQILGDDSAESDTPEETSESDSDDSNTDNESDIDDADEQTIEDIQYRMDELEDDVERKESTIRAIRSEQDEISDDMDSINERLRLLLGVYDQITDNHNPFSDGESIPESPFNLTNNDGAGFTEEETNGERKSASEESDMEDSSDTHTESVENVEDSDREEIDSEETVSFSDLKSGYTEEMGEVAEKDEEENSDDETVEDVDESENQDDKDTEKSDGSESSITEISPTPIQQEENLQETIVERIPETYTAEIVVLQWVSMLIRNAGTSGALRAFSYYNELGWINKPVQQYLETVLGAPLLEIDVDTEQQRLDSSHHEKSFDYIQKLQIETEKENNSG